MSVSRKRALEHAYQLLSRPRAHLRVELRQGKTGVSLLHNNRVLTRAHLNRSGMAAATAMAMALGVALPRLGGVVACRASTGLLYRVLALSQLDFRKPEAYEVARNLLEEAAALRSTGSDR